MYNYYYKGTFEAHTYSKKCGGDFPFTELETIVFIISNKYNKYVKAAVVKG